MWKNPIHFGYNIVTNKNLTTMANNVATIEEAKQRFIEFYSRFDKTIYRARPKIEVKPQPEGCVYLSCVHNGTKYGNCYTIEK